MAEASKLDEWGHIETHKLPDGAIAGVIERSGGKARICVALDGNPRNGYDLIFWYDTVDDASAALQGWDYPTDPIPPDCKRDIQGQPLEEWEYDPA